MKYMYAKLCKKGPKREGPLNLSDPLPCPAYE